MKTFKQLREKALTAAEKKKREEIAKAMERDNPDMPMDKKMAIATAAAKRVAEGTKQVLAHGGKGKYKVVSDGGAIDVMFRGKSVGKGDFDRGADSFFISIKGERGQRSFDSAQAIADYFAKNKITEEVELDEKKGPKIDPAKMAAHLARNKKPKKMTSTQKSLASIRQRANDEEVELDEISKEKLGQYVKHATSDVSRRASRLSTDYSTKALNKLTKRQVGIHKAVDRLTKKDPK